MEADKILAVRTSKTVYLDGDRVIKVFDEDYSKAGILNEALNQALVEETGLHIPKVLEVSKPDGKWAITSEYIPGKTLAQLMQENPDKKAEYLELFVDLQMEMHKKTAPDLKKLKDKMDRKICEADLDATTRYDLHTRLESMPRHNKLCHGDFNPSNIIITRTVRPTSSTGRMQRRATPRQMSRVPTCSSGSPAIWRARMLTSISSAKRAEPPKSTSRAGCRSLRLPSPSRASPRKDSSCSPGSMSSITNNPSSFKNPAPGGTGFSLRNTENQVPGFPSPCRKNVPVRPHKTQHERKTP